MNEEEDPLDPQIILERQVDELFEKADKITFFILNQIVERLHEPDSNPDSIC